MAFASTFFRDLDGLPKFQPVAIWFMRIISCLYIYATYDQRLATFDFTSEYFYLAIFYMFFSLLLFLGGFSRTSTLTRFAALMLLIVAFSHSFASFLIFHKLDSPYMAKLFYLSMMVFFVTYSKKFDYFKRAKMHPDELEQEIINEDPPALHRAR